MNIKFHSPVIISNDLPKMKQFYKSVLKQKIEFDFGNCIIFQCGLTLWHLQPDYPITRYLKYQYDPSGNKNLELCFETDDFEDAVREIKKHDVKFLHDVTEEKWGQFTVRIYDPENNLVEIGETTTCFVRRLSQDGLSETEISEKTSVPLGKVKAYLEHQSD